jgi:hypothetical protein
MTDVLQHVQGQPNKIGEAESPAYVSNFLSSSDGLALATAFHVKGRGNITAQERDVRGRRCVKLALWKRGYPPMKELKAGKRRPWSNVPADQRPRYVPSSTFLRGGTVRISSEHFRPASSGGTDNTNYRHGERTKGRRSVGNSGSTFIDICQTSSLRRENEMAASRRTAGDRKQP